MKRFLTLAVILAVVFTFAIPVMAMPNNPLGNPGPSGQNPNQNPWGAEAEFDFEDVVEVPGLRITVTGGGNNLRIEAICLETGAKEIILRQGNGTFTQTSEVTVGGFTYEVGLSIQGNSLRTSAANHVCQWECANAAPDCVNTGFEGERCSQCGATEGTELPALGHDMDEGTVTKTPDCCGVEGETTYTCERDGCDHTTTAVIPALPCQKVCTSDCDETSCEGVCVKDGSCACVCDCGDGDPDGICPECGKRDCECKCPGWGETCGDVCDPCRSGVGDNHTNCRTLLRKDHPQYLEFCGCNCQ